MVYWKNFNALEIIGFHLCDKHNRILILFWGGLITSIMGLLKISLFSTTKSNDVISPTFAKYELIVICTLIATGLIPCILGLHSVYQKKPTCLFICANIAILIHLWLVWFLIVDTVYLTASDFLRILRCLSEARDQENVFNTVIGQVQQSYVEVPSPFTLPTPGLAEIIFFVIAFIQLIHSLIGVSIVEVTKYCEEMKQDIKHQNNGDHKMRELDQYYFEYLPVNPPAYQVKDETKNSVEKGMLLESSITADQQESHPK